MNLYVILLLLAIQGLGNPTSGGDGPWSGEDVSGGSAKDQLDLNSATGTGEDNNPDFSGNDSGFHSSQGEPLDENLQTYSRTSRTYTSSKTITSGLGEDDGGSHSKSQWDSDDEGSNGRAEPKMDLAKIGDAIDVMKKLKKVKSDEEFARKLKSGPESLGVAFKTFEQLSGLWISVMHRIWRVWKAKGAKEVMHSIVHGMLNNTRRAIAQNVGNLLSNKTVLDLTDNGSSPTSGTALAGSDEGSSEPEISTHLEEAQNQQASSNKIPVHIISSKQIKSRNSFKSSNTNTVKSFPVKDLPAEKTEVSLKKKSSKSNNKYSEETQARNSSIKSNTKLAKEKIIITFSTKKSELEKFPRAQKVNNSALNKEGQKEISRTASLSNAKNGNLKSDLRVNLTSEPSFKNVSHKDKEIGYERNNSQGDTDPGQQSKSTIEREETGAHKTSEKNVTEGGVANKVKITGEPTRTHTVERSLAQGQNSSKANLDQERVNSAKKLRGSEKTVSVVVYRPENTNESFAYNDVSRVDKLTVVQEKNEQQGSDGNIRKVETDSKTISENEVKKSEYNNITVQKAMRLQGSAQEHGSSSKGVSSQDGAALDSLQNAGIDETIGEHLKDKDISNFRKKGSNSGDIVHHDTMGHQTSNGSTAKEIEKNGRSRQRNATFSTPKTSAQVRLRENLEPSTDKETGGLRNATKDFKVTGSNRSDDKADKTNAPDKILHIFSSDRQQSVDNASGNQIPSKGTDSQQNLTPQNESSNTPPSSENGTKSQTSSEKNGPLLVTQKPITHDASAAQRAENQSSGSLQITPNGPRKQKEPQSANNETKIELNFANIARVPSNSHEPEIDSTSKDKNTEVNGGQLQEEKKNTKPDKVDDTGDVHVEVQEKRKENGQKEYLEQGSKTVEQNSVQHTESNVGTLPKKKPPKTAAYLEASKSVDSATEGSQEKSNPFLEQKKDVYKNAVVTRPLKTSLIRGSRDPEKSLQNDSSTHRDLYPESTQKKRDETRKAADKEKTVMVGNVTKARIKSHSTIEDSKRLRKSHSRSKVTNQTTTPAPKDSTKDNTKTHNRPATKTVDPTVVSSGTHNTSTGASMITVQTPVQDTESGSEKSQSKSEQVIKSNKKHSHDSSSTRSRGESVNASNQLSLVSDNSPNQTNSSVETLKNITNMKIEDRTGTTKEGEAPSSVNNEQHKHMPILTQSSSSRSDMKPNSGRREEIKPSLTNKVDVLTSRTPPTSLLTTSSDDNTYSIKQLIQGPNGTSYLYPVEPSARQLERKVAKLESEVTVLEAAMADLAKRLLVVEQRPGTMESTMPPLVTPGNEDTLHESSVYNNQQTTVYLGKHVEQPPPIPTTAPEPERIVIPISSLTPGGEMHVPALTEKDTSSVLTDSALGHGLQNNAKSLEQKETFGRIQNNGHTSSSHTATKTESHAIVRPIVNIIMPNNREGLIPEGAPCFPRCRNGGSCLEGNNCKCPTFFIGAHCERFSLRDLLNSPKTWETPYRKPQRYVVLERPDHQEVERAFNLDSDGQTLRLKDFNPIFEPEKEIVAKQEPVEVVTPSNGKADVDDAMRRKQFILEI